MLLSKCINKRTHFLIQELLNSSENRNTGMFNQTFEDVLEILCLSLFCSWPRTFEPRGRHGLNKERL